jgi:hypothetical protein
MGPWKPRRFRMPEEKSERETLERMFFVAVQHERGGGV